MFAGQTEGKEDVCHAGMDISLLRQSNLKMQNKNVILYITKIPKPLHLVKR